MATFGLDNALVAKFNAELDVDDVRNDQATDFFVLPQLDAIYHRCAYKLKQSVAAKLNASAYGPKPPIEMEIPKGVRVSAKTTSVVPPNYFRPGATLYPEDRLVYHFIAQEAVPVIEAALDRQKVYSNRPLPGIGKGFSAASLQWDALKKAFEELIKSGDFTLALKCDISQYFFSINQHELVNQLEHQGFAAELVKFTEKFLTGLTLDRSSRGIIQGLYSSDVLGNGYLSAIDEFVGEFGFPYFRYVDDIYILFKTAEEFRSFFPKLVKRLRDYDLSLNESKTFVAQPIKLLKEETELDKAIDAAKEEAIEKLTNYEEIEIESGPYGETSTEIFESPPEEEEVELEATRAVFETLDDFSGEERHRAESFCLSFFRRASDPVAIQYVAKRWLRNPDRAREYALYLNRFAGDQNHATVIDAMILGAAEGMVDYQWAWAAMVMRRLPTISPALLTLASSMQRDGSQHDVVRSLLTYTVCAHGSAQRKNEVRAAYGNSPLLVQLAIIHCGGHFTAGERNALMATAQMHGELQALMCHAFKEEQKAKQALS